MRKNILVVDDDKDIRELITVYLKTENFNVDKASNGEDALNLIKEKNYDLVLLDIMMPKVDGIQTLIEIRKNYTMPVIFLTAKSEEIDMIKGLTLGADDYIFKPFSSMELIARVKSQLRRYTVFNNPDKSVIAIGDLLLEVDIRRVTVEGKEINLTPTEYKILELLCKNKNMVFSVEQIYENIWTNRYAVGDTSIMVHITKLRQKIEKDPKNPEYIKTVWGLGYKI
ncbi:MULTISPECIES: response regulator transcription factor [Clostridium]|uniref:response regulator transcription factor n=1 Tax=Clostridium TaxID=1485 RepID=UPI00024BB161|nr:response regulator transcription factor [Clostridium sporogenes]STC73953.1 two component transcriptional regulator [Clostridium botulinum]EHN15240.1 two component transcriptional regulator [Clostridium sporogenes PA 3679]MCW6084424.1 response regulator transcription factor [Clostridium sporogenes]MCW6105902.1 response regulator transcription factor [Clostridium sporogenes]NFQ33351.1 response regulator transcription factor [Clostridium sporogenes]